LRHSHAVELLLLFAAASDDDTDDITVALACFA